MRKIIFCLGLCGLILSSCMTKPPSWTPKTVAPPVSLPEGLEHPSPLAQRAPALEITTSQQEAEKTLPLSRDTALLSAFMLNRTLEVARFGPKIGQTYFPEARAAFDPTLSGSISYGRSARPQTNSSSSTSSFSTTQTGSSSSNTSTSAITTTVMKNLLALQEAVSALTAPKTITVKTDNSQGSLMLSELLPTGTQVALSGTASTTDSTLTSEDNQGAWTISLTQPLLKGGSLSANLVAIRQARNQEAKSEYVFRQRVLDIARQVELKYWDLVLAQEVVKIQKVAVDLAQEQLKFDQDLLDVGRAIEADVLAADAEKASREADFTDAQAAVRSQNIALVKLMNSSMDEPWRVAFQPNDPPEAVPEKVDANECERLALAYRPELAQARLELANLELDVVSARNEALPQLDVVASYGRISEGGASGDITKHLDDDSYENYRIGIEFQTPILYRAERARLKRAKLYHGQGERSVAELEQALAAEVRQAAIEVEKQWQRIQSTQKALVSRTEQLRVEKGRNEAGRTTNLEYLRVQRDFIQAQVDEITARIKYIQALSSLYAAEGTLLDRRGITLDTTQS
ncbi:MAG TPA: TolC family protein [Candidatus Hydrogenedentes bacterium]|nr:TolC family protein [Candidatus Hydrogenedentota bacterium]